MRAGEATQTKQVRSCAFRLLRCSARPRLTPRFQWGLRHSAREPAFQETRKLRVSFLPFVREAHVRLRKRLRERQTRTFWSVAVCLLTVAFLVPIPAAWGASAGSTPPSANPPAATSSHPPAQTPRSRGVERGPNGHILLSPPTLHFPPHPRTRWPGLRDTKPVRPMSGAARGAGQ